MEPMIGKTLRNYRITEKLGVGGQGAVYKATDAKLGRNVVIKVLPPELTSKEANLKRFEREARLASSLDHPNICTIFDLDEVDGVHFIAMSRHRYADVFRAALPIAGVDGTLRTRFRNTLAENNLRGKTGSLSSAASLSGYVTSAAGEKLVFSIMVNNYPRDVEPRLICIDPIAVLLASFTGKSE